MIWQETKVAHLEAIARTRACLLPRWQGRGEKRPKAPHVSHSRDVVEHDVAFPILRDPTTNLIELIIGVRGVVALVAVQTPVRELRSERRSNERVHRVYESEISAQAEHDVVRPGTAWLPEVIDTLFTADGREELPHRRHVLGRLTEAGWALEEDRRRAKNAGSLESRPPGAKHRVVDPEAARLRLRALVERAPQAPIRATRAEMGDHLPCLHRELERLGGSRPPPLERRQRRRVVEGLLHFHDRELLHVGGGADGEAAHPELHRHVVSPCN